MPDKLVSAQGISFRLFGFPVLYRWTALVLPVFYSVQVTSLRGAGGGLAVGVILAMVISIGGAVLVHELGHAATARRYGGKARIELVLLGGLTHHSYERPLSDGQRIAVSLAGTAAGVAAGLPILLLTGGTPGGPPLVALALRVFMFASLVWGVFNLLPLPGLDGSHVLDGVLRKVVPRQAATVLPIVTSVVALAAIVAAFVWLDAFAALWLLLIFGPELARVGERMRQGRDEPLLARGIEAERAYRRGELDRAASIAAEVRLAAESDHLRQAVTAVEVAALTRLGRSEQLLSIPGAVLGPVTRARALIQTGRLALAEAELRSADATPEVRALLAETLIRQDLDGRATAVVDGEASSRLNARVAELERTEQELARRMARVILDSPGASTLDRALATVALGATTTADGLSAVERWVLEVEEASRRQDLAEVADAAGRIPDVVTGRDVQVRLHSAGRPQAAALIGERMPPHPVSRFVLARSLASLGRHDEAMTALEEAVEAGWSDASLVVASPELAPLHGHPDWEPLLDRMSAGAEG